MAKKIIILSALFCLCALVPSCEKEPVEQEGREGAAKRITISEGLENYRFTAYVIKNFVCERIISTSCWDDMKDSLEVTKGVSVALVAYPNAENLLFSPSSAGARKTEYSIGAVDPGKPLPEIWCGYANASGRNEMKVKMTRRTCRISSIIRNVPENLDSITVEIPSTLCNLYPCDVNAVPEYRTSRIVVRGDRLSGNILPMAFPSLAAEIPVKFHFSDRTREGFIHAKRRLDSGDGVTAILDMTEEGPLGAYSLTNSYSSAASNKKYEHKLSLWDYMKEESRDFTPSGFEITSGVNLAFRFGSGCSWQKTGVDTDHNEPWLGWEHRKDVEMYCGCGYDHFRIPVDEVTLTYSNGEIRPDVTENLKELVDICIENGARVIIDLHWLYVSQTFPNDDTEIRFRNCWRILHELFKDYPTDKLAYELLNEPNAPDDYWNGFVRGGIAMVRNWGGNERNRMILVACNYGQNVEGTGHLELPEGDPNLIMTYHDYAPTYLTTYSPGINGYTGKVNYPGALITDEIYNALSPEQKAIAEGYRDFSFSKRDLEGPIRIAAENGRRLGVKVFCGEYGCMQEVAIEARRAWFQDKCDLFREYGMSFSNWYLLGESMYDPTPDPGIVKASVVSEN